MLSSCVQVTHMFFVKKAAILGKKTTKQKQYTNELVSWQEKKEQHACENPHNILLICWYFVHKILPRTKEERKS